jgi:hypothetical protein
VRGKRHVGVPPVPAATGDERPNASRGRGAERQEAGRRKGLAPGAKQVGDVQAGAWTQEQDPGWLERHQVSVAARTGDPTGRQLSRWARAQSSWNQDNAVRGEQFEVNADPGSQSRPAVADDWTIRRGVKARFTSERAHPLEQRPQRWRTRRRSCARAACTEQERRHERDCRAPRRSSPRRGPHQVGSAAWSGCRLDVRAGRRAAVIPQHNRDTRLSLRGPLQRALPAA